MDWVMIIVSAITAIATVVMAMATIKMSKYNKKLSQLQEKQIDLQQKMRQEQGINNLITELEEISSISSSVSQLTFQIASILGANTLDYHNINTLYPLLDKMDKRVYASLKILLINQILDKTVYEKKVDLINNQSTKINKLLMDPEIISSLEPRKDIIKMLELYNYIQKDCIVLATQKIIKCKSNIEQLYQ